VWILAEEEVGVVINYFSKVGVAAVKMTSGTLKVGDTTHIKGATTDFTQQIDSMEINKQKVTEVKEGDAVGIKVNERVRPGDKVYKVL